MFCLCILQSFQKTFNELNETQVDIDNDFMFDLDEDPENPMSDVNMDLFWDRESLNNKGI